MCVLLHSLGNLVSLMSVDFFLKLSALHFTEVTLSATVQTLALVMLPFSLTLLMSVMIVLAAWVSPPLCWTEVEWSLSGMVE